MNSFFVIKTSDLLGKTVYLLTGDNTQFTKLVFLLHIIIFQVNKFIMTREKSFMEVGFVYHIYRENDDKSLLHNIIYEMYISC